MAWSAMDVFTLDGNSAAAQRREMNTMRWEVLYRGRWIGIVESNLTWARGFWLSRPGFSLRQIGHA